MDYMDNFEEFESLYLRLIMRRFNDCYDEQHFIFMGEKLVNEKRKESAEKRDKELEKKEREKGNKETYVLTIPVAELLKTENICFDSLYKSKTESEEHKEDDRAPFYNYSYNIDFDSFSVDVIFQNSLCDMPENWREEDADDILKEIVNTSPMCAFKGRIPRETIKKFTTMRDL